MSKVYELPEDVSIATAEKLRSEMLHYVTTCDVLDIDASKVSRVDTAGVQLLAVMAASARSGACRLNWLSVSETLMHAVSTLGLAAAIGVTQQMKQAE